MIAPPLDSWNWPGLEADLDRQGWAVINGLLTPETCAALAGLYAADTPFRKQVIMARHGYGSGDYKYFAYPLPPLVATLRTWLYARLAPLANRWNSALGIDMRYPPDHAAFLRQCHQAGQPKPTPLLLRYGPGDFNCLHQDLYGPHVFPLQIVILLSAPGADFSGGELVLTEQRPRMQSRAHVVPLRQGDAAIVAVNHRPVRGARGMHRVVLRHGVSTIHDGHRQTLGIIFHDAA